MTDRHPTFVDFETARSTPGLRLVTVAGVPSLWSEAAKAIFQIKQIPFVAVRLTIQDTQIRGWTGVNNAPVAMYDDEPPRSGWKEILELAERLAPTPSLLPDGAVERTRMLDLANDVCGTMGIGWCARLVLIDESVQSQSERGWPPPVTKYLANKYAYSEAGASAARARLGDRLEHLAQQLQKRGPESPYFFKTLTALDLYSAAVLFSIAPLPDDISPMGPVGRKAFAVFEDAAFRNLIPPVLLQHRDYVVKRHFAMPLQI